MNEIDFIGFNYQKLHNYYNSYFYGKLQKPQFIGFENQKLHNFFLSYFYGGVNIEYINFYQKVEKTYLIDDLNIFSDIFEINLNNAPIQNFTTTINSNIYEIDIYTFIDQRTQISIKRNNEVIVRNADIKIGIDLSYLAKQETGQFFFIKKNNKNMIPFNYSNFGDDISLCYGILNDTQNIDGIEKNAFLTALNGESLAVW